MRQYLLVVLFYMHGDVPVMAVLVTVISDVTCNSGGALKYRKSLAIPSQLSVYIGRRESMANGATGNKTIVHTRQRSRCHSTHT